MKSCFHGYLTEACAICPDWSDGSDPQRGVGCVTPYPIDHCSFFRRASSSVASFVVYRDNGAVGTMCFDPGTSEDAMFTKVAKMICYADCTGIEVEYIAINDCRYDYAGWQPGMLFEFLDEDGCSYWSQSFPGWEH